MEINNFHSYFKFSIPINGNNTAVKKDVPSQQNNYRRKKTGVERLARTAQMM